MTFTLSEPRLEETKRISRILEVIQMIALRPRHYLRKDLAGRFEISEKMIQNDLDIVRNGLKLQLGHCREGYYFEDLPQLPAVQYRLTEAIALLAAVQVAQQVSGVGSPELAAAVARLETLFPRDFLPLLRHLSAPLPMSAHGKHRQQMLMLLHKAMLDGRKVRMIYETRSRGGEQSERIVRPYHLMPYVRSWQLIAYCEMRQSILMFKIDRIQQAVLLPDSYTIAEDFDLDEYLGAAWGVIRGDGHKAENVVLHFEADTGHRVAEEDWHPSQMAKELSDGTVLFELQIAVTPEFANWLLYYGSQVRVLEPAWLRERVREEHLRAAEVCLDIFEATHREAQ